MWKQFLRVGVKRWLWRLLVAGCVWVIYLGMSVNTTNTHLPRDVRLAPIRSSRGKVGGKTIKVAISLTTTTRGVDSVTEANIGDKLVFLKRLLPSFCRTRSLDPIYNYTFYMSYDNNDALLTNKGIRQMLHDVFRQITAKECQDEEENVHLKLLPLEYNTKPAWAQNDAMMFAYLEQADYFYRLNDDVELITSNWTSKFIAKLDTYYPRKVGMVSPNNTGEHPDHFEFDFVHRTHIDIFGFYYPRVFLDLYADEWISNVYA